MAYYDEQGFSQMQRDALERMRDMQRRSKSLVFESPVQADNTEPTKEAPQSQPAVSSSSSQSKVTHRQAHSNSSPQKNDILHSLLSGNGIDSERLLILLILFVLYKNNADIKLLIALGYLLI